MKNSVVSPDLLLQLAHRLRVSLGLHVGVEEGDAPEVEAVANHAFGTDLVGGAQDAAVDRSTPQARCQAQYFEVLLTSVLPHFRQ
jgi:hypothetical protein